MISLSPPKEPFELEIIEGVVFKVRPLSTFDMEVAQVAARQSLEDLETSINTVSSVGILPTREIDFADDLQRSALFQDLLIQELAARHIIAWKGVIDQDGNEVSPDTPNARRLIVQLFPIGALFYKKITSNHIRMIQAKKDCGAVQNGILSQMPVPDIVTAAPVPTSSVPEENQD